MIRNSCARTRMLRGALTIAAVGAAVAASGLRADLAHAAGTSPTFGRPVTVLNGWGFEPDLRIDTHGRQYMSVPNTLSSGYPSSGARSTAATPGSGCPPPRRRRGRYLRE